MKEHQTGAKRILTGRCDGNIADRKSHMSRAMGADPARSIYDHHEHPRHSPVGSKFKQIVISVVTGTVNIRHSDVQSYAFDVA